MQEQHVAIDGSVVSVESDLDQRGGPVTGAGWAMVPSMMRAHPFTVYPPGHSRVMENAVRENFPEFEMEDEEELSVKGGQLRVGSVTVPRDGGPYTMTVAAWEGRHGCMTSSVSGGKHSTLIEAFDTLQFSETERGVAIDSPIVAQPRPPELIQEIPGLGILAVRPAVHSELERVPRNEGRRTRHGEVFRIRPESRALLFLGRDAVARIQPKGDDDEERLAEAVESLSVEWTPRPGRRPHR